MGQGASRPSKRNRNRVCREQPRPRRWKARVRGRCPSVWPRTRTEGTGWDADSEVWEERGSSGEGARARLSRKTNKRAKINKPVRTCLLEKGNKMGRRTATWLRLEQSGGQPRDGGDGRRGRGRVRDGEWAAHQPSKGESPDGGSPGRGPFTAGAHVGSAWGHRMMQGPEERVRLNRESFCASRLRRKMSRQMDPKRTDLYLKQRTCNESRVKGQGRVMTRRC